MSGCGANPGMVSWLLKEALLRLASLPVAPLEDTEKLEQLRALHHGMEIRLADAACRPGPDVNTTQDLARASAVLGVQTR